MPLLFYFPFIVWIGMIKLAQDATHDLGELTTAQRLSDMDLHNMRGGGLRLQSGNGGSTPEHYLSEHFMF